MISISNKQERIVVEISLSIGFNIEMSYGRQHEMDAVLLRNQIQEDLRKRIEIIRREAYELGWKDAKSKTRRKRKEFCGMIDSDTVGW